VTAKGLQRQWQVIVDDGGRSYTRMRWRRLVTNGDEELPKTIVAVASDGEGSLNMVTSGRLGRMVADARLCWALVSD
jgi:hypothetical protein